MMMLAMRARVNSKVAAIKESGHSSERDRALVRESWQRGERARSHIQMVMSCLSVCADLGVGSGARTR